MTEHSFPINAECPFCGGPVDPAGWMSSDNATGPACDDCGASASTLESWNGWKARSAPAQCALDAVLALTSTQASAQSLPIDLARITELRVFEHGGFRAIVDGVGGWGSTQLAAIENATANAKKLKLQAITTADGILTMAQNALAGLQLSTGHWPPEFRVIIWNAVADIASRRAAAARTDQASSAAK